MEPYNTRRHLQAHYERNKYKCTLLDFFFLFVSVRRFVSVQICLFLEAAVWCVAVSKYVSQPRCRIYLYYTLHPHENLLATQRLAHANHLPAHCRFCVSLIENVLCLFDPRRDCVELVSRASYSDHSNWFDETWILCVIAAMGSTSVRMFVSAGLSPIERSAITSLSARALTT